MTSCSGPHLYGEPNFDAQQWPRLVACKQKHLCAQALTFDSAPDLSGFDVSSYLSCCLPEGRIGEESRHTTGSWGSGALFLVPLQTSSPTLCKMSYSVYSWVALGRTLLWWISTGSAWSSRRIKGWMMQSGVCIAILSLKFSSWGASVLLLSLYLLLLPTPTPATISAHLLSTSHPPAGLLPPLPISSPLIYGLRSRFSPFLKWCQLPHSFKLLSSVGISCPTDLQSSPSSSPCKRPLLQKTKVLVYHCLQYNRVTWKRDK